MSEYLSLSVSEINKLLKDKKILPIDLVNEFFELVKGNEDIFVTLNIEEAKRVAKELENIEVDNELFGIPVVLNDSIVTKNLKTTCGSKMLEDFIPVYDATVVSMIKSKNMIIVGKTDLDEFDIGSMKQLCAKSIFNNLVPISLSSDNSGNIHKSTSLYGVTCLKPTYGLVSRYGLITSTSSFEQIAPITKNVIDNAKLLSVISTQDKLDYSTSELSKFNIDSLNKKKVGNRIAIPNYYLNNLNDELTEFNKIINELKEKGFVIDYINMPYINYVDSTYNIISSGEASSTLSRYDGIRYGYSNNDGASIDDLYIKTRSKGFGSIVKQKIINGTYILTGDNSKSYYKSLSVRKVMVDEYNKLFNNYDYILNLVSDESFLSLSNLLGTPSLSINIGSKSNEFIGLQINGGYYSEDLLYLLGLDLEEIVLEVE